MPKVRALVLATALLTSTVARAADPSPTSEASERRLTPEQVEQVLDDAARRHAGNERVLPPADPQPDTGNLPVHGEVGFSIGTGGYRSAYGTAVVDLPSGGAASISVGTQRLPDHRYFPNW